jgi:hypothetical protein
MDGKEGTNGEIPEEEQQVGLLSCWGKEGACEEQNRQWMPLHLAETAELHWGVGCGRCDMFRKCLGWGWTWCVFSTVASVSTGSASMDGTNLRSERSKTIACELVMVVHACNPSHSGAEAGRP